MAGTPDKPEGTETHPPDRNPGRQGPEKDGQERPGRDERPKNTEPRPEASPGEPGVTSPKRGKV